MFKSPASAIAVVAMLVLGACGGSSGDADGPDTTVGVAPDPAETDATEPPTTDAPTTSMATTTTTTTSTTTPPTTQPPDTDCLQGSWWLSPDETASLYSALLPGIPVNVSGTHWIEFSGSAVESWVLLEARFEVGGLDLSFGIDQHGVGSYAVADDVLTMNYDTFESTIHEGHGSAIYDREQEPATYVDDAIDLADNGDGTITINRMTVPVIDVPPVAGGPMGCDGDTMSLGFTSGLADTAAVYIRLA